jgi:hypothetical protein
MTYILVYLKEKVLNVVILKIISVLDKISKKKVSITNNKLVVRIAKFNSITKKLNILNSWLKKIIF